MPVACSLLPALRKAALALCSPLQDAGDRLPHCLALTGLHPALFQTAPPRRTSDALPFASSCLRTLLLVRPFTNFRQLSGRRWRIIFRCWPPSAAQTVHAVFPHTAFTKTHESRTQEKELIRSCLLARTHRRAPTPAVVSSRCCASA